MLVVERQGRHRYHRLATVEIARMVEGMMAVAANLPADRNVRIRTGPADQAMRQARTCYDHLAGRVAVGVTDAMLARGDIVFSPDGGELTALGKAFLADIGIAMDQGGRKPSRRRVFCRPCLDWSERRPHIAGAVGAALFQHLVVKAWVLPAPKSRTVAITPAGRRQLTQLFALSDSVFA